MTTPISFADLGLADPLLRAIAETGYTQPTPIQAQAIPHVIAGGDVLAAAQTGTGKTAGFTLPILHHLLNTPSARKPGAPRVLVLTPTRELAAQVEESVRVYGQHTQIRSMVMFGGVNINPQISALRKPLDILVATPGRLLDHAGQKTVDLSAVEILVLDEADRMLDMGFIRDIRKVLAMLPKQRQNLLFSATFSEEIRGLATGLLKNPIEVSVARRNTTSELVQQNVVLTQQSHKRDLVSHIIRGHGWHQVLVFTRTKHGANRLAEKLVKDGLTAAAIHGNKSQAARTRALSGFKDGKVSVLVATDIAARGLDIDQLPQVVNFELPNVPEDYVHRIGRTGRAGSPGSALSLVDNSEIKLLSAIEKLIKRPIDRMQIDDWDPATMVKAAVPGEDRPDNGGRGQRNDRSRDGAGEGRRDGGRGRNASGGGGGRGRSAAGGRSGAPSGSPSGAQRRDAPRRSGSSSGRDAARPAAAGTHAPRESAPRSEAPRSADTHRGSSQGALLAKAPVR